MMKKFVISSDQILLHNMKSNIYIMQTTFKSITLETISALITEHVIAKNKQLRLYINDFDGPMFTIDSTAANDSYLLTYEINRVYFINSYFDLAHKLMSILCIYSIEKCMEKVIIEYEIIQREKRQLEYFCVNEVE